MVVEVSSEGEGGRSEVLWKEELGNREGGVRYRGRERDDSVTGG